MQNWKLTIACVLWIVFFAYTIRHIHAAEFPNVLGFDANTMTIQRIDDKVFFELEFAGQYYCYWMTDAQFDAIPEGVMTINEYGATQPNWNTSCQEAIPVVVMPRLVVARNSRCVGEQWQCTRPIYEVGTGIEIGRAPVGRRCGTVECDDKYCNNPVQHENNLGDSRQWRIGGDGVVSGVVYCEPESWQTQ